MQPISRETLIDRRQPHMRWGAVIAGTIFAIGLWTMLQVLGTGLGLAAIDTDDAGSLKGAGIGTGIWSIIAPLIAMFIGAYVAGRLSGVRDRKIGALHGCVMWALGLAIGVWAIMTIVGALAGGVARVGGAAASATSSVVSGTVGVARDNGAGAMSALGIDSNDLLGPVNDRLRREGKPAVTSDQLDATLRAVAQRGVRSGKLDRQVLVEELARNTSLSQADAQDIANQVGDRYQDLATRANRKLDQVGEDAKHVALEAADKTGKALLLGGLMMLLSLGAAIGGAVLGVGERRTPVARTGATDSAV